MPNSIGTSHPDVLRKAAYQQTNNGLVYLPPGLVITDYNPTAGISSYTHRNGVQVQRYRLQNRTGSTINLGLGFRLDNRIWKIGRYTAAGVYTDLSSTAQTSTSTSTLQVAGADQTGFVIGCEKPFHWVSVYITTAETNAGGSTVADHAVYYSQGSGWSASAITPAFTDGFTTSNVVWAAGVTEFVWGGSTDWTPSNGLTGLHDGYYWLRFTSAHREASDVAAVATGVEIGTMPLLVDSVEDNDIIASESECLYDPHATGVVAYFSTAAAGNTVYAECFPFM